MRTGIASLLRRLAAFPRSSRAATVRHHSRAYGPTLCLFSHYDPDNIVDEYVLHYLAALRKLAFEVIFVSTCTELSGDTKTRLAATCREVVLRENIGRDFGSWKFALDQADLNRYEQLVLANDSVYGPLFDLGEIFDSMNAKGFDLWGITDNWQIRYHVQSYFLVFSKSATCSRWFGHFWSNIEPSDDRDELIQQCEIGISQRALKCGAHVGSYCDARKVRTEAIKRGRVVPNGETSPLNSTHYFWDILIEDLGCPFMKIEPFRTNPHGLARLWRWEELIRQVSSYPTELILQHLRRISEGQAV